MSEKFMQVANILAVMTNNGLLPWERKHHACEAGSWSETVCIIKDIKFEVSPSLFGTHLSINNDRWTIKETIRKGAARNLFNVVTARINKAERDKFKQNDEVVLAAALDVLKDLLNAEKDVAHE